MLRWMKRWRASILIDSSSSSSSSAAAAVAVVVVVVEEDDDVELMGRVLRGFGLGKNEERCGDGGIGWSCLGIRWGGGEIEIEQKDAIDGGKVSWVLQLEM